MVPSQPRNDRVRRGWSGPGRIAPAFAAPAASAARAFIFRTWTDPIEVHKELLTGRAGALQETFPRIPHREREGVWNHPLITWDRFP